jgi:hypothetical protein
MRAHTKVCNCDIHKLNLLDVPAVVYGKTTYGPWANMCADCFKRFGVGFKFSR